MDYLWLKRKIVRQRGLKMPWMSILYFNHEFSWWQFYWLFRPSIFALSIDICLVWSWLLLKVVCPCRRFSGIKHTDTHCISGYLLARYVIQSFYYQIAERMKFKLVIKESRKQVEEKLLKFKDPWIYIMNLVWNPLYKGYLSYSLHNLSSCVVTNLKSHLSENFGLLFVLIYSTLFFILAHDYIFIWRYINPLTFCALGNSNFWQVLENFSSF